MNIPHADVYILNKGLRSKIPPAPIVEEGRWTQKTKVMRRGLAPLPEKSRIPGAPVPLVNMSALGKEVTRREPQKKKVSAREQPTARSKNAKRPAHKSLDSVGQKNKSVKGKRITTRQSTVTLTTPSPSVKHPRSNASVAKTTMANLSCRGRDGVGGGSVRRKESNKPVDVAQHSRPLNPSAVEQPAVRTMTGITAASVRTSSTVASSSSRVTRRPLPARRADMQSISSVPSPQKQTREPRPCTKAPEQPRTTVKHPSPRLLKKALSRKTVPNQKQGDKESKPEMSLWKRFKQQISSRALRSVSRIEEEEPDCGRCTTKRPNLGRPRHLKERKASGVCPRVQPPKSTDGESVCTAAPPVHSKILPSEVSAVTPRSLALTHVDETVGCSPSASSVLQNCTTLVPEYQDSSPFERFPDCSAFRNSGIQLEGSFSGDAASAEILDEVDSNGRCVFCPPSPEILPYKGGPYSGSDPDLLHTDSSTSAIIDMAESKSKSSPRKIFSNPLLSVSPDLRTDTISSKFQNTMGARNGGGGASGLRIPNMPFDHNGPDSLGTPGGPALRRADSSQIEAQCEWIRETLKEESRRLMTMTSMLEGLHVTTPRTLASTSFDNATNQDLNRRYIEKISDLQMENRYLRQLLEFSVGSMRRQSWVPTPAPTTPCNGSSFHTAVSSFEQSDDSELTKQVTSSRGKVAKRNKGKNPKNDPEYVAKMMETLEFKDQLLKFVSESASQITSLKGWYEKRLEELERDRKRLQAEKAECIKELKHCGVERCTPDSIAYHPTSQSRTLSRSTNM